jgi:hypothetical protein
MTGMSGSPIDDARHAIEREPRIRSRGPQRGRHRLDGVSRREAPFPALVALEFDGESGRRRTDECPDERDALVRELAGLGAGLREPA